MTKDPIKRAATRKRWQQKNKERINAYMRRWLDSHPGYSDKYRVHPNRPAKPVCECGNTDSFRWFLGKWVCNPCSAQRAKKKASQRGLLNQKRRSFNQKAERLKVLHGPVIAAAFREVGKMRISIEALVKHCFPGKAGSFAERVLRLNKLSGKSVLNIGWDCACGEHSDDPSFFDLDHVTPRHRGGRTEFLGNLQIFCPNCHRRKTISDRQHFHDRTAGLVQPHAPASFNKKEPLDSLLNTEQAQAQGKSCALENRSGECSRELIQRPSFSAS